MPEPTHFLEIGTPVRYGRLEDVVIVDILFDGKAYEIDFTSTDTNYGRPIRHEHQRRIVKWTQVRKIVEKNGPELVKNEDMRLSYQQRSLQDVFGKAYDFGVNFDPDYQRGYVWNDDDKIKLIDSIFNHVDIGKFVYVNLGYSENYIYEILDGKQRMRAILDYYEDRFAYKGKFYSDLSNYDQGHFDEYPISYAELSHVALEQKLRYFLMLNTGGRIMSEEHLDKVRQQLKELKKD